MKVIKNCLLYVLFLLMLVACTEPITIETDSSDPVLVIYSIITGDLKHQEVRISRSSPYFDNEPNAAISGAYVKITSSDGETYLFEEDGDIPGTYYSIDRWAAQEGLTYHLAIEKDFNEPGEYELYEASTTIPYTPPLDSIKIIPVHLMGHRNYFVNVYGQDPPTEDYYLFKALVNDSLVSRKMRDISISDDIMFNGEYINGLRIFRFDDISERENDTEEQREESIYIQSGDVIEIEGSIIPRGYFDFIYQCTKEQTGENPMFGGPPSNITTNISNGAVGYFAGYTISRAQAIVK